MDPHRTSWNSPGIYRIRVRGKLQAHWGNRFGGLNITELDRDDSDAETLLVGRIADQSALMGVLNALCEAHCVLLAADRVASG